MRRSRRRFLNESAWTVAALALAPSVTAAGLTTSGITFYIDTAGDNANVGTSPESPWKDFTHINSRTLAPGDCVLLKRGCVWRDELRIQGAGTASNFVTVAAYGSGARPKIQRQDKPLDRCVRLHNSSFLRLSSLEVSNAGAGIYFYYEHSYNNRSVYVDDIVAHDFRGIPPDGQAERVTWSYGIGVTGIEDRPNNQTRVLSDFRITNTEVYNSGAGIALDWGNHTCVDGTLAGHNKFGDVYMENLNLHDNTVEPISFASLFLTSVSGCVIHNSVIDRGTRFAGTGTSSLQLMYARNVVIRNVTIRNTPFDPCPDNTAIDFECDVEGVTIESCLFENNAGPAIEMLATPGYPNGPARRFSIRKCTFIGNNWARKLSPFQIVVTNWDKGNRPQGSITDNRYSNVRGIGFFGGDGDTSAVMLSGNTSFTPARPALKTSSVLRRWDFAHDGDMQGWRIGPFSNGIAGLRVKGGALGGTFTGPDPSIVSADNLNIEISGKVSLRIVLKNASSAQYGQIYFITSQDEKWNEIKHRDFPLHMEQDGYVTYDIDMSTVIAWKGALRCLRIDPEQGAADGSFGIRSIALLRD